MTPRLANPLLYLITNRRAFLRSEDQFESIRRAARAGCQLIQIREKDLSARELRDFVASVLEVARPHGAKVLVNDRLDVALAAGADGVHLRVNSLSASEIRAIVHEQTSMPFLIGASTHSLAEAKQAESEGADFIVFGPIFDTPSKRGFGPPLGAQALTEACNSVHIPVLAIGGITTQNAGEVLRAGARGIAAISLFTQPNAEEIVRELREMGRKKRE